MFARLVGWVLPYAWPIAAAAGLALLGAVGVQSYQIKSLKLEAAVTARNHAQQRADQESTARIASENFRRTEADLRARVDFAQGKYDALQQSHTATLAAHRASDSQLRNQLAAYAAGSREPTDHSCAPERERAEALGLLLADGVRLQDQLAADAEAASDAVRALIAAWPKPEAASP